MALLSKEAMFARAMVGREYMTPAVLASRWH
jgi:hypothetical protein